jgi:aminopeptidase YwaD
MRRKKEILQKSKQFDLSNKLSLKFTSLFLITYLCLFSQLEEGKRITKELCSEKYFGRGYVKSGDSLAAEYLALEFEKRGLKKIKNSYFQVFSFDVNTFPNEFYLSINGKDLKPGIDFIVDPASGPSNSEWEYKFYDQSTLFNPEENSLLIRELRENRTWNSLIFDVRNIGGDSLKKIKAFQRELANFCNVLSITNEKFTFSISNEQLNHSLIYVKGEAFINEGTIISRIDAVLKKNHQARNVLALLPAKNKTKKSIFISAHYDHLGGIGNSTYFSGGNDNASGTSMLFTLADYFKKKRLKYNLVFVAFAGEEAGLIGSKYYTENPLIPLKNIKFLLNLDIMGSGEEGITVVNATKFPDYFDKLYKINEEQKLLSQIKKRGEAANSDHYWFTQKGIPSFFIYTMGPNKNYHDVFDTYENLSFNKYEDLIKLLSLFLKKL